MEEHLENFLKSINKEGGNRWIDSGPDIDFFNICADELNSLKVKTVLDICCGAGDFINICTEKYNMEAYGIDPRVNNPYKNLYNGTIESVILNQNLLNDFKFDCISIQNTLHGHLWQDEELINIIQFLKKFSKYIVISDPINNPNIKLSGLTKIHSFDYSHGGVKFKNFIHKIYKVN